LSKKMYIYLMTYIWGAGHYGVLTALDSERKGIKVAGFIDSNAGKIKTRLGLPVLAFEQVKEGNPQIIIAVKDEKIIKEISEKLSSFGLKANSDFRNSPLFQNSEISLPVRKKIFLSYAEFFEDYILHLLLHDVENGFYVDVGAFHSSIASVTKYFYENEWTGVNIEPEYPKFQELKQARLRDMNVNCGCGSEEKELEFYVFDGMSTCDSETINSPEWSLAKQKDSIKKEKVLVRKLTDILQELKLQDKTIHFLKIDVEGFEGEVLKGLDFSLFRPYLIVMEATIPGTDIPCHERWEHILTQNSYEFIFSHSINRYYADRTNVEIYNFIKKNLSNMESLSELYDIYKMSFSANPFI